MDEMTVHKEDSIVDEMTVHKEEDSLSIVDEIAGPKVSVIQRIHCT